MEVCRFSGLLADPKHFYRSFTASEIRALMERVREMPIYKRYFDLIASGRKTVEVRVAYPSNKRLANGQLLRFTCRGEQCLTRIRRVAYYNTFEEMFDHENAAAVNPDALRAEQLASIRLIYPAEKEALGVIAIDRLPRTFRTEDPIRSSPERTVSSVREAPELFPGV